jgi:iron(III) transport system substrate-binding protein
MIRTSDRNRDITRRTALTGLGAIAALGPLAPLRAMAAEDWPAVQAASLKEGKLSFYHNLRPQGVEQLLSEFRKANPGIQTEQIRLGSAPLIERFSTEFNAGRNLADVMLSFPDDAMFAGVDKGGWAAEWTPPELSAFRPVVNHGNKAFAVHTSRNVIIYNKQRVKPADAPKEWTDLWDSKWKGKVGMDPPWRSVAVQGVVALWVKNGIADAAQKLKANDVRFFEGSAGVFQAVLRGDVMVATLADLPLEPGLEDGAPIGFVYPKSGTATNDGYVMVNARAPHPNVGKVFVNWLMSAPGQLVLQEQGGLPVTRPAVPPTKFIPATSELSNAIDSLTIVNGPEQNKTIETWRETFGIR